MNYLYLIAGSLILILVIYDFFYTTLSGGGAFFISKNVSGAAHSLMLALSKPFGRRFFMISGMAVNLSVLVVWVVLVWLGLLFVYSYNPEAITNSSGRPATFIERSYFAAYILSTLGVGNFKPTSNFFEIITSIFSFFGFVFFTTAMTYLIQVTSAVMHKRSLALTVNNLGKDPVAIIESFLKSDKILTLQQINSLQQMIDRHNTNHQAFPVLHYYNYYEPNSSLSLNISRLDEAVTILRSSTDNLLYHDVETLNNSLESFLKHVKNKYGISSENDRKIEVDWGNIDLPSGVMFDGPPTQDVYQKRKILDSMLKSEKFEWKDVYLR